MKKNIKLKPVLLNILLTVSISTSIILSTAFFLFLNMHLSIVYLLCSSIVLILILISFRLNYNEPEKIVINDKMISVSFMNKFFFKRKEFISNLNELELMVENNKIIINQGKNSIKIRKSALFSDDWNLLRKMLSGNL